MIFYICPMAYALFGSWFYCFNTSLNIRFIFIQHKLIITHSLTHPITHKKRHTHIRMSNVQSVCMYYYVVSDWLSEHSPLISLYYDVFLMLEFEMGIFLINETGNANSLIFKNAKQIYRQSICCLGLYCGIRRLFSHSKHD